MPLPTKHTTNTRDEYPYPQRDANPWSQQSSGFRPSLTPHGHRDRPPIITGVTKWGRWDFGACSKHSEIEKCIPHFSRKPWGEETLRKSRRTWGTVLKCTLNKQGVKVSIAFVCLRIGNTGRLLWIRQWIFSFLTVLGIYQRNDYWLVKNYSISCSLLTDVVVRN